MGTRRTILIGQAPSSVPGEPLSGKSGKRLASSMGISFEEYESKFEKRNLLGTWPGKNGKGDAFPVGMAVAKAAAMIPYLGGRRVLFVGKLAAGAFGFHEDYFEWGIVDLFDCATIPHPSGINRWWNDAENVERASKFLRREARR